MYVCVNDLPALPHAKLAKKQLSHDRFFVELLHPYGVCNLSICFKRESGKERAVSASLSSSQTSRHGMCMHECLHVRMCGYTRHTYIHTYVCMNARSSIYVYTNLRTYVGFIYLCMRVCVSAYLFTLFEVSSMRWIFQGLAFACSTMTPCISFFRHLTALNCAIDAILNYEYLSFSWQSIL